MYLFNQIGWKVAACSAPWRQGYLLTQVWWILEFQWHFLEVGPEATFSSSPSIILPRTSWNGPRERWMKGEKNGEPIPFSSSKRKKIKRSCGPWLRGWWEPTHSVPGTLAFCLAYLGHRWHDSFLWSSAPPAFTVIVFAMDHPLDTWWSPLPLLHICFYYITSSNVIAFYIVHCLSLQ